MTRKEFLAFGALTLLGWEESKASAEDAPMPVLFLGHGSPMNIVETNDYTRMLRHLGGTLRRPRAVLVVSAHWNPAGTWVTTDERNEPMYDFFGFPDPLYEIRYTPPGSPETAGKILERLSWVQGRTRRIDHGAWALLYHLFPDASVPVLQLSIDSGLSPQQHYALGRRLAFLRSEGVLIIGSGNVTHNLRAAGAQGSPVPVWAERFDRYVADAVASGDAAALIDYRQSGNGASESHPSDEHYLPLLYAMGAAENGKVTELFEGFQNGSISMRSWMFGEL